MSSSQGKIGQLFGVSAGPGDPELITVKGLKQIQAASVVAFPAPVRGSVGVAERIIEPWLKPEQTRLALRFPMVAEVDDWREAWQVAADDTWDYLQQGHNVVFVSEGDVSFYSTYSYLAHTLRQKHPELITEAIPGVCSPLASVASLQMPLTTLGDRLAVLPALYCVEELPQLVQWADVLVLMKVGSVYPQVWEQLQSLNLLSKTSLVIEASHPEEQIVKDLTHHRDLRPPYFSLLIVRIHPDAVLSEEPLG